MQEKIMSDQTAERSEEDVFGVCDTLKSQEHDVTRQAVLASLGHGSLTTFTRLVSLWEDRQKAHILARDVDLSAEGGESILADGRQRLRALTDRMRQQATEGVARLTQLAEEDRRRVTEVAQAYDDLVSDTEQRILQIQADAARTTEQLRHELEQLKVLVVDQEKQLMVERDRTEHANEMKNWMAKQRDEEMRMVGEGRAKEHLLSIEVYDLKTELKNAKDSLRSFEIHNKIMQNWLDNDKETIKNLKVELEIAQQEREKEGERVATLEIDNAALEANVQAFTRQVDDYRERLTVSDAQMAELIATLQSSTPTHGKRTKPAGSHPPMPFCNG